MDKIWRSTSYSAGWLNVQEIEARVFIIRDLEEDEMGLVET